MYSPPIACDSFVWGGLGGLLRFGREREAASPDEIGQWRFYMDKNPQRELLPVTEFLELVRRYMSHRWHKGMEHGRNGTLVWV